MSEQPMPTGWQPIATVPRDGTLVDFWSDLHQNRTTNRRFIRAAEVDARYAEGGEWEHLAQDGFRVSSKEDSVLTEECYSHWRLTASDRP